MQEVYKERILVGEIENNRYYAGVVAYTVQNNNIPDLIHIYVDVMMLNKDYPQNVISKWTHGFHDNQAQLIREAIKLLDQKSNEWKQELENYETEIIVNEKTTDDKINTEIPPD